MKDFTDSPDRSRRRWAAPAALAVAVALIAGAAPWVPPARADGDPASDVLATQTVFTPGDGGIPIAEQRRLAALVAVAGRAGYPIRVALIASPADLGSVTALWRRPAYYARFLAQELSLVSRATLLVAMPNGFGIAAAGPVPAAERAALAHLAAPGSPARLASAATIAVQHLALVTGHRLAIPRLSSPGARAAGSADIGAWAALAAGLALIAAAWTASLRARPPGSRRRAARGAA
jgi:hypothetical protein